jgi:hypothetical protein
MRKEFSAGGIVFNKQKTDKGKQKTMQGVYLTGVQIPLHRIDFSS